LFCTRAIEEVADENSAY